MSSSVNNAEDVRGTVEEEIQSHGSQPKPFPFSLLKSIFFFKRSEKDKARSNASFICKHWSPSSFTVLAHVYVSLSIVSYTGWKEKRCHRKWKYTEGFAIVRCYLIGIKFHLHCFISLNVNLMFFSKIIFFFFFKPVQLHNDRTVYSKQKMCAYSDSSFLLTTQVWRLLQFHFSLDS